MKKWMLIFMAVAGAARAYQNATLAVSACGSRLSGGRYTSIGSLDPLGGQGMQAGRLYNHSGFAAGFILQPQTAFSGLADEWNPDNDLDGMGDAQELIAGTSPTDRDSVLAVACTVLPNGQKWLSWFGVRGRVYTLQYADSLAPDAWQSYPGEIAGADAAVELIDAEGMSRRFYRVKVRRAGP